MQGRLPWMMFAALLAATSAHAETVIAVSASQPPSDDMARPATEPAESTHREWTSSILRLPSEAVLQAVLNGRQLRPAR